MSTTIDIILESMPWAAHGIEARFDRQGRATILNGADDRYVRIEAKQVSGISTSNLVNGLVVTCLSATAGQLDRMSFQFGAYGVPAKLTGMGQRNGTTEWYWTEAMGSSRYDGPIDGTDLVNAVAEFMATMYIRPAAEHVEQLDPLSTLVLELWEGPDWNYVLSNGLVGMMVHLHMDDGTVHYGLRIDRVAPGEVDNPSGFEAVFGHQEDEDGEAIEGSEVQYLIGSIVKVVVL